MREFLKVLGAAAAVLAIYFGYLALREAPARQPQFEELRKLVRLLEQYRDANGRYPQFPGQVPIGELKTALADSGATFLPRMDSVTDPYDRYISVDGNSYGILFYFRRGGSSAMCLIEMRTFGTGWWGQPPPCPL